MKKVLPLFESLKEAERLADEKHKELEEAQEEFMNMNEEKAKSEKRAPILQKIFGTEIDSA